jgi:hypothetical protein
MNHNEIDLLPQAQLFHYAGRSRLAIDKSSVLWHSDGKTSLF